MDGGRIVDDGGLVDGGGVSGPGGIERLTSPDDSSGVSVTAVTMTVTVF